MKQIEWNRIAQEYGTPTYVFDVRIMCDRIRRIRELLPGGTKLCFAMKANPFLAGAIADEVDRLEVCSPGEYEICIREHVDPDKIVISGVNKTEASIRRILEYSKGAGIYTIESELHYEILKQCAVELGCRLQVLLRLSSGNQFGMDQTVLEQVLTKIIEDDVVDVAGIHFYSGTQKKMEKVEHELTFLAEYGEHLRQEYRLEDIELEYGPGLMVSYFQNEKKMVPKAEEEDGQLSELSRLLQAQTIFSGISIELGRFLAYDCGYYMTRIMDKKCTDDTGFVIVDGGIHQLNYYGQMMGMKQPYMELIPMKEREKVSETTEAASSKWTICGSLCTVNDVIVRQVELPHFETGDVVLFERCGAYAVTEGMALFLSRELPQVLLINQEGTVCVQRPITQINILNGKMEEKNNGRIN